MMAAPFRPASSIPENPREDVMTTSPVTTTTTTTTSPRPSTAPHPQSAMSNEDSTTPTRAMFGGSAVVGQKPLPSSPFPQAIQIPAGPGGSTPTSATGLGLSLSPDSHAHKHDIGSQQSPSTSMQRRDHMDVDMDESDGEAGMGDDGMGSDDESVNADGTRSSKKKKSQRFYCTDYPPCNLSFTRSEHLARHIRKHTGERPFQCHCSRRFSRLDNLRQHAQTVHVNEDIPMDSLAATGSRFQRQIRTDRVRQAGNRARASTGGSAGGPPRGHSKSLSTSSINSVSSVGSAYSAMDARRRPPPLVMSARPSTDYRSPHDGYMFRAASPSDFSTPTSATFSTGQGSPRWGVMGSPTTSSHSRSQSMYTPGTRTPGRRLSVPSGVNPFQSPHGHALGRPMFGNHGPMNSSNAGAFSPNSSLVSSPTASTSGWSTRRDSTSSASEEAWRRRTWHPDSRSFNGNVNQLNNITNPISMRPNPPPPIANPSSTQSSLQLPGIESFDTPASQGPITPPRQQHHSPMVLDSQPATHPVVHQVAAPELVPHEERRNLNMYDASLQRGLNRLDISHTTPPRDSAGAWASEVHKAVQAQAEQVRMNQPTVRFENQPPPTSYPNQGPPRSGLSLHQQTMSAPSISNPRDGKRRSWYNGPGTVHREEAPRPQQDPRAAHVDRMVHPNFTGFSGFPSREMPPSQQPAMPQPVQQQQPPQPQQQHPPQVQDRPAHGPESLRRLEALVAVATSEVSTATAY